MAAIDDLINDARNYAVTTLTAGATAMNAAMNIVSQIATGSISTSLPAVNVDPPTPYDPGEPPAYTGPHFAPEPFAGEEPNLDDPGDMNMPDEPGDAPEVATFNEPQKPGGPPSAAVIANPPTITSPGTPPTPPSSGGGPSAPPLLPVTIPPAPVYQPPVFVGTPPIFDFVPPTSGDLSDMMRDEFTNASQIMLDAVTAQIDAFIDHEFPQHRASLAALEAKLAQYLQGGTALTPAVENAIYNRTLDKTNEDAARSLEGVWLKAAKAGFSMPSPMLAAQMFDVEGERRKNNGRAATEIAIKQAELEQNNVQFAITQTAGLRKMAIDAGLAYYNGLIQINGQALEYARGVVDSVIKAFELACRYAELQIRIYEAEMHRYEMELKAALAVYEVYKAQVEAAMAIVAYNKAQVDLYQAQLMAEKIKIDIYQAQVDAYKAQVEIEKLKLDIYQAQVNGYVAQVNGYSAEWNGYSAACRGESAKVEASAEQVKAYATEVQAYEALIRAESTRIESITKTNEQRVTTYKALADAYHSLVSAQVSAVNVEIGQHAEAMKSYTAKAEAYSHKSKAEITLYEIARRGMQDAAELQYKYMVERNSMEKARAEASGQIAAQMGNMYARTAQATVAGLNTLAAKTETATAAA